MIQCPLCKREMKSIIGLRRHFVYKHNIKNEEHRNYSEEVAKYEDIKKAVEEREQKREFNYERLLYLTKDIPKGLDFNKEKERVDTKIHNRIIELYQNLCYMCNRDESLLIHHRIPSGEATEDNLFPLCEQCHDIVHIILWLDKKWIWRAKNRGYY